MRRMSLSDADSERTIFLKMGLGSKNTWVTTAKAKITFEHVLSFFDDEVLWFLSISGMYFLSSSSCFAIERDASIVGQASAAVRNVATAFIALRIALTVTAPSRSARTRDQHCKKATHRATNLSFQLRPWTGASQDASSSP